jgi:apolipoprotein D and lipocalin family protein
MKTSRLSAALLLAVLLAGCVNSPKSASIMNTKATGPLRTVQHVDLPRFMGDWRVIANIPYFAEKGCVDSIETYALRPDGKIDNFFTYRKKAFDAPQKRIQARARVHDTRTNAEWRIRFFGLITVDYLVLDLDPDYRWTAIGHPSRKYGWIMAREKTMADKIYNGILNRLAKQGYDPAQFKKVPQLPSQIGFLH